MKTLIVYYQKSIDKYPNYIIDYTEEIDNGILKIYRVKRETHYDSQLLAVYKSWDFYKIETMDET